MTLPSAAFETEERLLDAMTTPRAELIEFMSGISSPLVLLGAGGKMGPTLAVLAKRAALDAGRQVEVIAVSRFSDPSAATWLRDRGVQTLSADLLDRGAYRSLPGSANLIYLVGLKFGTSDDPSMTWAANTVIPTLAAEHYPEARWSILSTGNVYPLVNVAGNHASEEHVLTPLGEYPNAAVARERVFQFHARRHSTPMIFLRLSYAIDLRYGVLVDLASKIWRNEVIDLTTGYFNCIWQGDANEIVIRALGLANVPPKAMNLTGRGPISVRRTAQALGELMGRTPLFLHEESATALLSDTTRLGREFGELPTSLETMIRWVAEWVMSGRRTYGRPTHFEVRDGKY